MGHTFRPLCQDHPRACGPSHRDRLLQVRPSTKFGADAHRVHPRSTSWCLVTATLTRQTSPEHTTQNITAHNSTHHSPQRPCGPCRDGTLFATCSSDGLSRLWDFRTGRLLRTLLDSECSAPITALHFCPNGRYLLESTLQDEAMVRVWDWQRREGVVVRRLRGHQNSVYSLPARFVYGAWAASASEDGAVVLWHINSGKVRLRPPCMHTRMRCAARSGG